MTADLIDRIYECSVVPELWPEVLEEMARLTDSRGGLLFSANKTLNWTASANVKDVFRSYVEDGWFARCSRRVCLMSQSQPSFFSEHDFWTDEELGDNPIYRDFFRPAGLGWSAGTGIRMSSGDNIVFSVEREYHKGPLNADDIARLNELRPHLIRSAFVTARLGLQRARGATEALTAMGLPALILDEAGRVIEANPQVDALSSSLSIGVHNRLALADMRANDQLSKALVARGHSPDRNGQSFPVRDADDQAIMVAHVMPIRRSAHDVFGDSHALLVLTTLGGKRAPSAELIRSLFDLTVAEARIASGLATGDSLESLATAGDVAITTVRSQLRRVLEKTGCTRQAELVSLLADVRLGQSSEAT